MNVGIHHHHSDVRIVFSGNIICIQGLGKDGSGMTEPVQAQAMDSRAGLGSQQKKMDPSLEIQAGDSYKTLIHKKALARFREMS